ncbi:TetR/AcrR family transcriptional regulator [Kribbella kalugense]|uniref:TetR family transcriptional regulator n=1 Tax=Kribbella kalugense TaxID=2512221 RepID=A0A4R7ZMC6_9ACTN|nr:TetR/AcrR family transcriptional regulator [Kribbella kalugense]TDW17781.1 TetR family transcriptional regulator [Kribbella kalugense]
MTGLRERKKFATRQALGIAAMRLAIERGLENVLVEDIAAAAGVSPRTYNNYFANKYEAICALATDRAVRAGLALRERPPDEPLWESIRHSVLVEYEGGDPDPEWVAGVRLVTAAPELHGEYLKARRAMEHELADAIAVRTGASAGDLEPVVLAAAVNAATEHAVGQWLEAGGSVPVHAYVQNALCELESLLPVERPIR